LAPFTPSHALPASHRSPPQAAKRSDTASAEAPTDNLNRALHTIALHRRQHDPAIQKYIARRVAEGKSKRDATRLLKRYLARHLYRLLQQTEPQMT
jgi:hypothetical protein